MRGEPISIGQVTSSVPTWNPARVDPDGEFTYIDLAAVDQSSKQITEPQQVVGSDAPSRARQLVAEGDVLVSTVRPNLNAVAEVTAIFNGATASTGFTALRPSSSIDSRYLFHWVKSPAFVSDMTRKATGASYPAVSDRIVRESSIPLPLIEEQRRIAAILDHADALRAKRRESLARLDELTQSIFIDMFGDPISNLRSWPKRRVADIGTVTTGNTPPRERDDLYGDHIEWIKSDNINVPSALLTPATEGLSVAGARVGRVAPAGSILMTCIAGSPSVIGNVGIADRDVAFNQQINAVQPTNGPTRFWYEQLRLAKRRVQDVSTGGMKGLVSKSKLENVELICPPYELQEVFADRAMEIVRVSEQQQSALGALDALFASLQSRAFRGEL